ncbi:sodium/glutamate symporter [Paracoccus cavernae]|uniref:Sodium/glutamate symporter n=1 Tax=Paracoccus cavernae TaxID=1571207 RepID=A0ABT8D466_9RHOB|nr:sodium/glutamate symporter [Paracoccus cavernae]
MVLTIVVGVFILVQNITGITMATLFGMPPLTGLVTGSITLTGGHGTAAGWGPRLEELGVTGATTLGIACATFGLVIGGLLGGPVARRLIAKHNLTNTRHTSAGATPTSSSWTPPETSRRSTRMATSIPPITNSRTRRGCA